MSKYMLVASLVTSHKSAREEMEKHNKNNTFYSPLPKIQKSNKEEKYKPSKKDKESQGVSWCLAGRMFENFSYLGCFFIHL